ncbi:YceD family protein [Croceivirga thetidis]|uniref:DUF177 domain-containing protein n=1 Tax=Croceivirga thetidis TaxID=2721623 RepID=A0ABX1GN06_9FLAO|nr:DUF177 domain-containing protein [Croceivirga thetidis]NKI31306.1 DUF177 domain-containing protein [Croceivirga thetidis]
MESREFVIPFSGLKIGSHRFDFKVDNSFFESFDYQDFNSSKIDVEAQLTKTSTMMELELEANGQVNVDCDVTGEPFDMPTAGKLHLVVKFGEEYDDLDDELLIIPHGESQLNIAQYVYEMLVLAVPQKRVHPGIEDGSLKSEVLDKLKELKPKEEKNNNDIDPRWDDLKKLLTDK